MEKPGENHCELYRAGRFRISEPIIRSPKHRKDLEKVFSKIIVVGCEHDYLNNIFEYTGYSELFDIVDLGSEAPQYMLEIRWDGQVVAKKT